MPIINEHKLIHAKDAGNGYHGICQHCGIALVTDLGYCSWDGLNCIDREISDYSDIPAINRQYASFAGYKWSHSTKMFVKPYTNKSLSVDELIKMTPPIINN